ncbi:MAG: CNNM domain-containing protein [Chthoniobacterales bacterium]
MIWIFIGACLVVSFIFSGIESGVLAVNRVRLRHHARTGDQPAQQLEEMLQHLERLMISVVLVTNTANILAVALLYQQFAIIIGEKGAIIAIVACIPLLVLVMEFLPKAVFRRFPYRALVNLVKILGLVHLLLRPFIDSGVWVLKLLSGGQTWKPARQNVTSGQDIRRQINQSATPLGATEKQMIDNVLEFRKVRISDVLIPMKEVVTILPTASREELLESAKTTDIERFPIMTANGEVLGLVQLMDFITNGHEEHTLIAGMRRIVSVGEKETGLSVLQKLRAARLTLALVVAGNGKPAGIVTSEDLIRRLLLGKV